MKKLLVLVLVLVMAGFASAGIINVVQTGWQDTNLDGKVNASDMIYIMVDTAAGYRVSGFDLDLHITGPGTLVEWVCAENPLEEEVLGPGPSGTLGNHADDGSDGELWAYSGIAGNGIVQMMDAKLGSGFSSGADLVWALAIHCDGPGDVIVDLTIHGPTQARYGTTGSWIPLTGADLGGLVIHQVPEPATIAVLSLGGLLLRRKK